MATLSIKLTLPEEVLKKYELRGSLEKVLSEQLTKCVDFTSQKPIYITDALRRRLDRLFGKNFEDAEVLVGALERFVTARIGDVDVVLPFPLLSRLKSRCFGKPFEQFLTDRVIISLEEYCGIR